MRRIHSLLRPVALAIPCALAMVACGSSESSSFPEGAAPGNDAGADVGQPDASTEAAAPDANDPQPDSGPDAGADASVDSALDALPDQAADQAADVDEPWPTCDTQPNGVPTKTIAQLWQENSSTATPAWVPNVIVTGISKGACVPGSACQIFLQTEETYATLAAGAHQAIKLFVSGNTSQYFTSLQVGDRVDVYGHAWRYTVAPPQNELLLQVNLQMRGCAKKVGTANPTPIVDVQLSDLTLDAYENTLGPLLVQVQDLTGKPDGANQTFAVWKTGGPFVDAGPESIVSASPYFLPGGAFTGLPNGGQTAVNFDYITGVFGLFVPTGDGGTAKYLELYVRQMTDMPHP